MPYKTVIAEGGRTRIEVNGDGLLISNINYVGSDFYSWLKDVAAEFERANNSINALLFNRLAKWILQVGYLTPHELQLCGFSSEFINAWIKGNESGLIRLSLMQVESVVADSVAVPVEKEFTRMLKRRVHTYHNK